MNINDSINRVLEEENRELHEASVCVDCTPGCNIKGATWTTRSALGTLDRGGFMQYFDGEDNVMLYPYSHALITGCTGSGKSESFIKNQIELSMELPPDVRPSMLVTDIKGDIYPAFKKRLEDSGYTVDVLHMGMPFNTSRYNIMLDIFDDYNRARIIQKMLDSGEIDKTFLGTEYSSSKKAKDAAKATRLVYMDRVERGINELSYIIVQSNDPKDKSWCEGARTMLKGILWSMLKHTERESCKMTREMFTVSNVCRIAFSTEGDCEELIEWLSEAKDIMCVKSAIGSHYDIRAKQTRDSYISTLNTALEPYSANVIEAITATSDELDIRTIASSSSPRAIFIVTDDRRQVTDSICMMFINSLINELMDVADTSPTGSLNRDFVILADEFANMPAMPNISKRITTLRSRRIWMVMAIQSLAQLEMVYGKETSTVIQDNCDLQMFLGSNNYDTKLAFTKTMGEKIGVKKAFQLGNDSNASATSSTENVPVLRISDLDSLELGEFYVKTRRSGGYKTYMQPHFRLRAGRPEPKKEASEFRPFDPKKNAYSIKSSSRNTKRFSFDF